MGFFHNIGKQFKKPEGLFGKIVGNIMTRGNLELNNWTIDLLKVEGNDHVLELGFGAGFGIKKVSSIAVNGSVSGVDYSELMLKKATQINSEAIMAKRVHLQLGDVSMLPYEVEMFDKVYASQLIYFCNPPAIFLQESKRVLKPGGKIAISFIDEDDLRKLKFTTTGLFTFYTKERVLELLEEFGFKDMKTSSKKVKSGLGICVTAFK